MLFQVTWVEHFVADNRAVHPLYQPLVNSGLAFGAERWLATLGRQCERLASARTRNIPAGEVGSNIHKQKQIIEFLDSSCLLSNHFRKFYSDKYSGREKGCPDAG